MKVCRRPVCLSFKQSCWADMISQALSSLLNAGTLQWGPT